MKRLTGLLVSFFFLSGADICWNGFLECLVPLRELPLDSSSDRVIVIGSGLEPDMCLLTLVVNGKDVEKKRVIYTKYFWELYTCCPRIGL
jgi:hypothetical protein